MIGSSLFVENLKGLLSIDHVESIALFHIDEKISVIPNMDGKRGSLQIYANVMNFQDGVLGQNQAERAIELFGEYVEDAKQNPGKHPNIDMLFKVQEGYRLSVKINYKTKPSP